MKARAMLHWVGKGASGLISSTENRNRRHSQAGAAGNAGILADKPQGTNCFFSSRVLGSITQLQSTQVLNACGWNMLCVMGEWYGYVI